jgi:hypothetical protein
MRLCLACGRPLTAQQARAAFARMLSGGLTVQEARTKASAALLLLRWPSAPRGPRW